MKLNIPKQPFIIISILVIALSWYVYRLYNPAPLPPPNIKDIINRPLDITDSRDIIIMAAGDISCNRNQPGKTDCQQNKTAELIEKTNPDIVLALGDIQYGGGSIKQYQDYYDSSWGKFKDKTYPSVGNHEYETKGAAGYFEYFQKINNQHFYSFDAGDWHIISLDSNCWAVGGCGQESVQLKWLISDLEKNQKSCTLAFWHHPRFSSGLHGNYGEVQDFWEVLYKHKVELVLNGHDHLYERFLPQNPQQQVEETKGITQFIVGTGGRNLYPFINTKQNSAVRYNEGFGVLKLTLKKSSVDYEFLTTETSNFKDIGSIDCH